jgi:alpha-1,2-mannosyltransferase
MTAAEGVPLRNDVGGQRDGSDRWAWLLSPRRPLDRADVWILVAIWIAAFVVRVIPVLIGGGLLGLQGYDDGVYFGAASSLIHGVIPYRDFLLLHPPGIVLALTPFAMLGTIVGDPAAFAAARVSFMALGAMNAVLVALVAGRYRRLAGIIGGGLYAVWNTSANAERTADLLALENALLLLGLLVLAGRGRITPRWAAVAGIALGLAVTVHLWQAISAAILLWWVVVRARGDGWDRVRPGLAFLLAAGIAFGLVCLPFILAAPEAIVRYVLVDQVGRPSMGIGLTDRLLELAGLTRVTNVPAFLRPLFSNVAVLAAGVGGLAVVVVTAWRLVWTRPWAALAIAQSAVVLLTPSFFHDYPAFAAPATTLVLGTGLAAAIGALARRGMRPVHAVAAIIFVLTVLGASSLVRRQGDRLSLAPLEQDVSRARCVSSDTPALLVLTSALRRNIEAGCALVLDPTGTSYDTDRGRLIAGSVASSRQQAPAYQQAMLDWYTSGDAALFARHSANGLTAATEAAIELRLPVERQRGIVTVRLARSP